MKFKIVFIGLLTMLAGVIPILDHYKVFKSPVPVTGWIYASIIIGIGVIDLLYSFLAHIDLIGFQHVVTGIIAGLTIFGGVLPFVANFVPKFIPTSGVLYYSIIIVVGLLGFIYGCTQLRY